MRMRKIQKTWVKCGIHPYKKYHRVDGKIIIVEKGVYEVGHYGQNYNKVVLECNKMHYHEIYVTNYC